MATGRLIDSQRQELVRRFREGESTQLLADQFGCSPTTITRMVRAEMSPAEYAQLREQRQKKPSRNRQISLAIEGESDRSSTEPAEGSTQPEEPALMPTPTADGASDALAEEPPKASQEGTQAPQEDASSLNGNDDPALESTTGGGTVLAIDDADDFGDDEGEEDLLSMDDYSEDDGGVEPNMGDFHPVAVLPIAVDDQQETLPAPWSLEGLPSSAYLLVDKTVELQAKPLGDIPELGRLPNEELQRQALVLFTNPRQAKRHCGRTQRVIKLPDLALLGRTAPYLLAQGISRVVIEGALYALPEGQ
ncbi:MAG: helix-turn-helix domain-containing protein [Cyanobacteriota bacterium]|jgi:hypothetical protein